MLERIAGIRSKTLEDDIISWLEFRGEDGQGKRQRDCGRGV